MTSDPTTDDKDASSRMPCQGKVKIQSYVYAKAAAKRRKGRQPYRCRACRCWHVGTRRPS
ncbi:hypothetical protein LCGC14_1240130 [marine sediment metagenome]|uniref:Uncharacterized protein n=1 Tax=marine sediment metagenome TaxID=412755 RepID=A0A0F9PAA6_9ZZZZ